jgi:hypothetical protein
MGLPSGPTYSIQVFLGQHIDVLYWVQDTRCMEGSSIERPCFNLMVSHTFLKFNERFNFPDFSVFFTHFSHLIYFKGARPKTDWIPLTWCYDHSFNTWPRFCSGIQIVFCYRRNYWYSSVKFLFGLTGEKIVLFPFTIICVYCTVRAVTIQWQRCLINLKLFFVNVGGAAFCHVGRTFGRMS